MLERLKTSMVTTSMARESHTIMVRVPTRKDKLCLLLPYNYVFFIVKSLMPEIVNVCDNVNVCKNTDSICSGYLFHPTFI